MSDSGIRFECAAAPGGQTMHLEGKLQITGITTAEEETCYLHLRGAAENGVDGQVV